MPSKFSYILIISLVILPIIHNTFNNVPVVDTLNNVHQEDITSNAAFGINGYLSSNMSSNNDTINSDTIFYIRGEVNNTVNDVSADVPNINAPNNTVDSADNHFFHFSEK
ncbi:26687_t:CDS:1 [Dentiscutata erythropus]|uniref:26687_t:CDS:1 n=1 Tax=Dentiscutata erythropus TaxID=1348616 RepID=A0A9N9JJC3_9GLOM|nr:26687_t:CDS:1 [Dentiscutata erythropus]